jgi:hypothetical protein
VSPQDRTAPPDVEAAGRALADKLKREAREDLPVLLALWELDPAPVSSAA